MTAFERQIAIIAIIVVVLFMARNAIKSSISGISAAWADKKPDADIAQLAVRFKEAFNPYFWGMGTDVEALFQLALESRGIFNEVARNYKQRYGSALNEDLSSELDSDDLAKFYQILNA